MQNGAGVEAPDSYSQYSTLFKSYDGFGNLTTITDPRGVVTTNTFDALGRLLQRQVLETNGAVITTEKFAYEPGDQVTLSTNALGGVTQTLYTQTGKPYYILGPNGATNLSTYYLDGRPKRQYLANGSYWQTVYDDVHLLVTRTFYTAGGTALATNIAGLDRRGNQIVKTDEAGNSFTNSYDGLNRVKSTAGPLASYAVPAGSPGYPGSPTSAQQTSTIEYDAAGLAVTNVNALGEKTISLFDVLGRVTDTEIHDSGNNLVRITTTAYSADHQSQTVTQGSGSTAIVSTVYTDNQNQPVLSVSYPSPGVEEFVLRQYDLVENLVSQTHNTVSNGTVTQWTTATTAYDGLNRPLSRTDRDGAVTSFTYDPASNLTNEVMPGGLVWRSSYNSALQRQYDCDVGSGSSITRSNYYTYNSTTGLLQTNTDGRGVICTHTYDAFLRPITNIYTGSLPEQDLTDSWAYDPRGLVTNILESFASTNTGPSSSVARSYDAYGQLQGDTVSAGSFSYQAALSRDSAGRRQALGFGTFGYGYTWLADNLLASSGGGSYTYDTAGQLLTRAFSPMSNSISQRDGNGRPLSVSTTVNGLSALAETLTWTGDGLLSTHTLVRPDFTDQRSYSYANQSRRLTQEIVGLATNVNWTNTFVYDGGVAGGPGVLTGTGEAPGATNVAWHGGTDAFSRINAETNSVAQRQASGQVNGVATMTALLDGDPMPVTTIGTNALQWRAELELLPGAHQLIVNAVNWSGFYTASATNTFTNNAADRIQQSFSADGELTNRVWMSSSGTINRTQTLSWDAKGRLHGVTDLDSGTNGFSWTAVYDGLGRRLQTTTIMETNGVGVSTLPKTINQYYDPGVEFLELAVAVNGVITSKFYGPDANGVYGGMNGVGGLEAVSSAPQAPSPVVSDIRGNGEALYSVPQSALIWYSSHVTAYGAVPGYRPLPLGDGSDIAAASAWRGKWADITDNYQIGLRPYGPIASKWLSADPLGHSADPSLYAFCAYGDPINYFDSDGRIATGFGSGALNVASGAVQLGVNTVGTVGYGLTSMVNYDAANALFGPEQQGLGNTLNGVGSLVNDVANAAGYAVTSPFAPAAAYQAYGPSMQQLAGVGTVLTGGSGQSGAYQIGFAGAQVAGMMLGGEAGEADEVGQVMATGLRTVDQAGISASDALQIQNAADRTGQQITVVGSQAAGTAGAESDWDYIFSGPSAARHSAASSVPVGNAGGAIGAGGTESGIDIFQSYNPSAPGYQVLNPNLPHVIFTPKP